jgi:hypothetical protein
MVLQDQSTGHSLIAVFHDIRLQFPPETKIPPDAVIPREWAIFTKWELDGTEEGQQYVSIVEVFWPDGKPFAKQELQAAHPIANGMAFVTRLAGFPMGQPGELRIKNSLSKNGEIVFGPMEIGVRVQLTFDLEMRLAGVTNTTGPIVGEN